MNAERIIEIQNEYGVGLAEAKRMAEKEYLVDLISFIEDENLRRILTMILMRT